MSLPKTLYLTALCLLTSACSSFVDSDQTVLVPSKALQLESGRSIGQTFVAQHGGLNGIEFWLQPSPDAVGVLTARLRVEHSASTDLAVSALAITTGTVAGFWRFSWDPDASSHGAYRYVSLEFEGKGSITVGAADGESYRDGSAYIDGSPQEDRQLAFRLVYDWGGIISDLGNAFVQVAGLLAVGSLLLIPGLAVLVWIRPHLDVPIPVHFGIAVGTSIAIYPLVLLWTYALGISLGSLNAWIPVLVGAFTLVIAFRRISFTSLANHFQDWRNSESFLPDIVFVLIFMLVVGTRFVVVRSIEVPPGSDSLHHVMIVQLISEHGGLFESWLPYAPLDSFSYHFGFHAFAVAFHWLTGLPPLKSTLVVGQMLNAVAATAVYSLGFMIGRSRWIGTLGVLIAGLVLPMPMAYTNWGRYPQVTGQVLLPQLIFLAWKLARVGPFQERIRYAVLLSLLSAGLALTHYRVSLFFAVFFTILCALMIIQGKRGIPTSLLLLASATTAFVATAPWWLRVAEGELPTWISDHLFDVLRQRPGFWLAANERGQYVGEAASPLLWLFWLIAIGYGLWMRNRVVLLFCLWFVGLLLLTNPEWIGLPGGGAVGKKTLAIASYIGISPLLSFFVVSLLKPVLGSRFSLGATCLSLVVSLLGSQSTIRVFDGGSVYVRKTDLLAAQWIRESTPQGARFFILSSQLFGNEVEIGIDAGWWLPITARRQVAIPPLTSLVEKPYTRIHSDGLAHAASYQQYQGRLSSFLADNRFDFVYIGQSQHSTHSLRGQIAQESEGFEVLYARDRVRVLRVKQHNR